MRTGMKILVALGLIIASAAVADTAASSDGTMPSYLRDRGTGIRTSMFGTFVQQKELLIYAFYEYYLDNNLQYTPTEYGGAGLQDFEGRYRANEGLIFAAYGISDRVAIEMEAAVISASFERDPTDGTGTPARLEESGLGDVEGQVHIRLMKESEHRPEIFSFFEAVIPHAKDKPLIGTEDWEGAVGAGVMRGYGFGTVSARVSVEYAAASDTPWDLGEWGVDFVRRGSPSWLVYAGIEGQATDEVAFIGEVQRRLNSHATLKLGAGVGLAANSTDFAPEVGIIFNLPTGGK
jgi:hypothetical protein